MAKNKKKSNIDKKQKFYNENIAFLTGAVTFSFGNILLDTLLFPIVLIITFFKSLFKKQMKPQEYEARVAAKLKEGKMRSLNSLGIVSDQVREVQPIMTTAPKIADYMKYDEKTGRIYSAKNEISIIFFGQEQLYTFNYVVDMTKDYVKESTAEYFYKDIVSVEIIREYTTNVEAAEPSTKPSFFNKVKAVSGRATTSKNDTFSFITTSGKSEKFAFISTNSATGIDAQLNAMKQYIRDKRAGY